MMFTEYSPPTALTGQALLLESHRHKAGEELMALDTGNQTRFKSQNHKEERLRRTTNSPLLHYGKRNSVRGLDLSSP